MASPRARASHGPRRRLRRRLRAGLEALLAAGLALQLVACGTLLYPERHGHRHGRIDPAVLLLDGALLVLFLVPGLVAFGIDFHTGAIYVPDGRGHVKAIPLPPGELDAGRIESLVRAHTGCAIDLDEALLEIRRIPAGEHREDALRSAVLPEPIACTALDLAAARTPPEATPGAAGPGGATD